MNEEDIKIMDSKAKARRKCPYFTGKEGNCLIWDNKKCPESACILFSLHD